jgi:hypothetical protein
MNRFKSSTGFQDMIFNMLLSFVFLFVVALLLINPITKKSDAPKKAEYLISISWADESYADLDLWVRSPSGAVVSFTGKSAGFMHLERDDLGRINDTVDGVELLSNEETVTLRGIEVGEYEVMLHPYLVRRKEPDNEVVVRLIRINPYGIKYESVVTFEKQGQHVSLFRFTLDKNGDLVDVNNTPSNFIPIRGR